MQALLLLSFIDNMKEDIMNYTTPEFNKLIIKHDIAIVGCWDIKNYGSQLTYYALYHVLKNLGYSSILIGCHKKAQYKSKCNPELFRFNPYPDEDIAPQFKNKNEMFKANLIADIFIVGSDQIWNNGLYKHFGEFTLLDYIYTDKTKISYAASFGNNFWNGNEIEKRYFQFCLNRFNKISVRETSGINVCKEYFGVDADWVIDPIFLLGKKNLLHISKNASVNEKKKFVFAYLLDYSSEKLELLNLICKMLNCHSIIITDPNQFVPPAWRKIVHTNYSLEDWIWLFQNAEYVLTDSFHGMCVSLVLEKNFTAIINQKRGAARFVDYAKKYDLNDYIISDINTCDYKNFRLSNIDYEKINIGLLESIQESEKWLKDSIVNTNQLKLSTYDMLLFDKYVMNHMNIKYRILNSKIIKFSKDYGFMFMCKRAAKSIGMRLKRYTNIIRTFK